MGDERYDAKSRTFWGRGEGHEDKGGFNQLSRVTQITQKSLNFILTQIPQISQILNKNQENPFLDFNL